GDADVDRDGGGACSSTTCTTPVDDGCGTSETCNDGLDNNCNGRVDENCSCTPGTVQPCFLGPPGRRGVGACVDGMQRCEGSEEFGRWGECAGGIWPLAEQCDTQDNNCNGCADDNPSCCKVELKCPGPSDLPEAAPFNDYVIDGTRFWAGDATAWKWTVAGGPCDQLLSKTSGSTSYTLNGDTTSTVTFRPTLSGDYTFTMTVTLADGTTRSCTFIVHVRGPGLRVELCWDTTGKSDVDLHVHKPGSTTSWFTTDRNLNASTKDNPDDCFYHNCKAACFLSPPDATQCGPTMADFGYASSPLAECEGGPEGRTWRTVGACHNPRLDVDNIKDKGRPENINVDVPRDRDTFRVMVHYYQFIQRGLPQTGDAPVTQPLVNVYCGGRLTGTYGATPDVVPGFDRAGGYGMGDMWRVVDVTTHVDGSVTTGCTLSALHPPSQNVGYWVTTDDRSY
ncbi:MAG: hypothetical protein HY698_13500, partial [Deltaproteobacteria bacterium]|nr:hypothetical protein [Deltaproteobacteria bacterium]